MRCTTDTPRQKLDYLKEIFQRELPNKLHHAFIEAEKLCENLSEFQYQSLKRTLHTLAGSTGGFGFITLSESLRTLEYRLPDFDVIDLEFIDEVKTTLQELISEYQSPDGLKTPSTHLEMHKNDYKEALFSKPIKAKFNITQLIVLYGFNSDAGSVLKGQLESYGFNVAWIDQLTHLESFDKHNQNTILVVRLTQEAFNH